MASKLALACALFGAASSLRMGKEGAEVESFFTLLQSMEKGLPAEFNTSRLAILADLHSGRRGIEEEEGYDCESNPHMCKAPFHCDQWTHQDTLDIRMHGIATSDQHPNLRSWCMPGLERYASTVVKECLVNKDMRTSSKVQLSRTFKEYADELDASYCFAEGHCTYAAANDQTTMSDMEKMCDYRFGERSGWTRNFVQSLKRLIDMPKSFANLASAKTGFATQRITRVLTKMACAQGTFHCDVQYCKQTYCRDEYYVQKYSHLLPSQPGHLFRDPDNSKFIRDIRAARGE